MVAGLGELHIGDDLGLVVKNDPGIDDRRPDRELGGARQDRVVGAKVDDQLLEAADCRQPEDAAEPLSGGIKATDEWTCGSLPQAPVDIDPGQRRARDRDVERTCRRVDQHVGGERTVVARSASKHAIGVADGADIGAQAGDAEAEARPGSGDDRVGAGDGARDLHADRAILP